MGYCWYRCSLESLHSFFLCIVPVLERTKASAWETKGRGYGYFLEPDKDRAVLLRPSVVKSFTILLSARMFIHDFFIFTSGSW